MKILHITNQLAEGGVESFLLQLLPSLKEQQYEVALLALSHVSNAMQERFENSGIKVFVGKYNNPYNPLNIFCIKKLLKEYDIVHVHLWPSQLYVALASCLFCPQTVLMTTEHNNFNKRRKYKLYRPIEQWMYHHYKVVVGVCKASQNNLLAWIHHEHVIAIPNGINIERFCHVQPYTREELKLPPDSVILVMTARFFAQKDQLTLIRAMPMLPNKVYLILIGSGESESECRQEAENLHVISRVRFLGRRSDVAKILALSDMCVLSTHYEGLPISVIEYMAMGKAVIGTDVDGVRELINNPLLLAKENDPKDLALKIKYLIDNPDIRKQVALKNFHEAQKYNLRQMIEQYVIVYKQLSAMYEIE